MIPNLRRHAELYDMLDVCYILIVHDKWLTADYEDDYDDFCAADGADKLLLEWLRWGR